MAMCVYGLMYNWTVFSPSVQEELNVSAGSTANVFSFCQVFLTLGGLISGFIYHKVSYKLSMILSSIFLSLGLLFTSVANNIILIYVFYSFLYTFFAGFSYKSLLTAIMGYYKEKSGLASGILLMGAELTAFIFNYPTSILIYIFNYRFTMKILSFVSFIITMLAALIIKQNPESNDNQNQDKEACERDVSTLSMLKTSKFWVFFLWSILLMAGCTSIMGNAVNCGIYLGISSTTAALLSSFISLANSLSRIAYGYLYDKKGGENILCLS